MQIESWAEIATSQAVWAILCIMLAVMVIRELRKENIAREAVLATQHENFRVESALREEKLMQHLERSNESQEQTTSTLKTMSITLQTLEGRMDRMEKLTYRIEEENR